MSEAQAVNLPPVENLHWLPPTGEYFGWLGDKGFNTLKVSRVVSIWPQSGKAAEAFAVGLDVNGLVFLEMPAIDGFRLMKRLGWKEPGDKFHA